MGKLTISRRYNQLPLLRSSPGGFEGSWPYGTYPYFNMFSTDILSMFLDCGCKGRHFFLNTQYLHEKKYTKMVKNMIFQSFYIPQLTEKDYFCNHYQT
ncbi:hypothetical protein DWY14_14330 [Phocaeicola plebeius]|uniref:Uncharacterized protein n=1 Tax=Phocaeicola plebeius TaxID=310297 RepID=A0A412H2R5_9BACT|nr:hypothetical protein DWY14_14330 [Phocaeicola plebeius]